MESLARAWTDRRQAKIYYRSLEKDGLEERIIEPYFIQPAALEHATYVIAHCHRANAQRIFKVERIRSVEVLKEHYTIPEDFDANEYLASAWGIMIDGHVKTIKLRFTQDIARVPEETTWHPTQTVQRELGNATIVTMQLPITAQLESFILGWGEKVEVLEPKELRERVARTAQEIVSIYNKK